MSQPKDEIIQELDGLRKIVRMLRKRRFILEEQMAAEGIQARPQTVIEVEQLIEQIDARELEITRLETRAVEDRLPLSEARYQLHLAQAWNTPRGKPDVIGLADLELERLQLGISPERASILEQTIRTQLAEERLLNIRLEMAETSTTQDALQRVIAAWRLDPETVTRVFQANIHQGTGLELPKLLQRLQNVAATTIWTNSDELRDFRLFLEQILNNVYGA